MPIRARYTGQTNQDGEPVGYLHGVPARDLDEDEYQALTAEQRAAVRSSGLYDCKTDKEMAGPRQSPAAADAAPPVAAEGTV